MYEMLSVSQHVVNMGRIQNSELTTDRIEVNKIVKKERKGKIVLVSN
jgi:hypothetical protein